MDSTVLPSPTILLFFSLQEEVSIQYVKLHADPKEGKSLDISKISFFLFVYVHFSTQMQERALKVRYS